MSSDNQSKQKLPPGQRAIKRLLRWGTDHPGIASVSPKIALDTYMLTINGEVKNPVRLNWKEVLALPKTVSVSDFHCVEGWSVLDCRWEGVRFRDIEKLVKPLDTAKAVTFECADAYTTSLLREELANEDVLLAYRLNGQELEQGYGFPLRLVVPNKYAYKSALWVVHIQFTHSKERGFWERRGYSDSANMWKNDRFNR
jgi:DMSO/TMAO reductase YedYZ molybdopterin-dependent catalytic subunit